MAKQPLTKKEKMQRSKRRRRQLVGMLFVVLASVGAVSIIVASATHIAGLFDDTEDKQDFQRLIAPLVALDPAPFASIDEANADTLLEASIWAALTYEDTTKYERNEHSAIILPAVDVDRYANAMYGPSYKIEHHTFSDLDITFEYLPDTAAYVIPITSQSGSYTPIVETITSSGNTKTLHVAYMQASAYAADVVVDADAITFEKYMDFTMIKQSKGYYIYAISASDAQPEAATNNSPAA